MCLGPCLSCSKILSSDLEKGTSSIREWAKWEFHGNGCLLETEFFNSLLSKFKLAFGRLWVDQKKTRDSTKQRAPVMRSVLTAVTPPSRKHL